MKRTTNPKAIEITRRFFNALEMAIELGKIDGVKNFCDAHSLNRVKYASMKNQLHLPVEQWQYKTIDVDALAGIVTDFGVSADWLLIGRGKMLKTDN